jgi:undecaprenyl-diphosphatase
MRDMTPEKTRRSAGPPPLGWTRLALWRAWAAERWRDEAGMIPGLFAAGSLVLGFVMLADEVIEGDTQRIDEAVLRLFRGGAGPAGPPWLAEMGRDVTALGSFACLGIVFLASLGYLLLLRKRGLAALMAAAVLGGAALSTLLKVLFDRPRPDLEGTARVFTASFPSGHAMLSAVTFLTLGALLARANADRRIKVYFMTLAVLLTMLVGLSRLYLGVHYPSDVLAGWCLGTAWAVLCWTVARRMQRTGQVETPAGNNGA